MEIVFKKSSNNKIFWPWLGTTGVTITILALFHIALYYLFYTDSKTLAEHFTDALVIYFYALIWPLAIVNSYKSTIIKVTHNGEYDPQLVKTYFQNIRFNLIDEKPGHFKLEAQKFYDRLFPGSKYVKINFTPTEMTMEVPFHQRYNVHHAFKFTDQFIKK
jgi:hypothetical protein